MVEEAGNVAGRGRENRQRSLGVVDLPRYLPRLAPPVELEATVLLALSARLVHSSPPLPLSGLFGKGLFVIGLPVSEVRVAVVLVAALPFGLACLSSVVVGTVVVNVYLDIRSRGEALVYRVPWVRGTLNWQDEDWLDNHDGDSTRRKRARTRRSRTRRSRIWIFTVFDCGLERGVQGLEEGWDETRPTIQDACWQRN